MRCRLSVLFCLLAPFTISAAMAQTPKPTLAPAVGVEAEHFTIASGWKVLRMGEGNYSVDIIGFCHISGERLLSLDATAKEGAAHLDVNAPISGPYRLWVRYEYPPFCETRFKVAVEQNGKVVAEKIMGTKESLRLQFNNPNLIAQYDPPWGSEGTAEEPLDIPLLNAGPVRIHLLGVEQPQTPGVAANRNIDLIYLTSDVAPIVTEDGQHNPNSWYAIGGGSRWLYPILNAFRDTVGARFEVRVTNQGEKPMTCTYRHVYNRMPWYVAGKHKIGLLEAGATSEWTPLPLQDTVHFSLVQFDSSTKQAFAVELRPIGGNDVTQLNHDAGVVRVYIPPYPRWGERPGTPRAKIDEVLQLLEQTPAPGREPTLPLTFGWTMPAGSDNEYQRKYAQLYRAIGMRSLISTTNPGAAKKAAEAAGLPLTRTAMIMLYRNPPIPENIEKGRKLVEASGMQDYLRFFDYGDEISFAEWIALMVKQRATESAQPAEAFLPQLWRQWLAAHRPGFKPADYWLASWGDIDPAKLKPDSSGAAANEKPRLYVDSLEFYESAAIEYVAERARVVKETFGSQVLCGANYSCHPLYYPELAMYVHWFRGGAADFGRHSEYFWQVSQAGPMINGYITEHFRAGMRFNPNAIMKQYTMPHAPGNTDANFLRTAFTHLAHGAKTLDYFGIGMNETFTENHVDHRQHQRYVNIRNVNHSIGLVEDLVMDSTITPSQVAILASDSTERWDFAAITADMARKSVFDPEKFRHVRMSNHLDRLGLWKALTFAGSSPDILVEEDLTSDVIDGYKLLFVVGDCIADAVVPALERWTRAGGVVVATTGVGQFNEYREPNPAMQGFVGITSRTIEERSPFMRVRQELPFLKPVSHIVLAGDVEMPAISTHERIVPVDEAEAVATFKGDGSPAVIRRDVGAGKVFYVASLPGVAYLWSALQPPVVPDRADNTHTIPEAFDPGAAAVVRMALQAAKVDPPIVCDPPLVDARLATSPNGCFLPVANYHNSVGQSVNISLRVDQPVTKVTSAYHGPLEATSADGRLVFTIPALGYGDMIRLDTQ